MAEAETERSIADSGHRLVPVLDLAPTQVTIGFREMEHKRRSWREKSSDAAAAYLASRPVPIVLGPDDRYHMIDRHHFLRALHEEGVRDVPAVVVADMSALGPEEFWRTLERRNWAHPFDEAGWRRLAGDMPRTVLDLRDDVFRSLAGALERAGGYSKSQSPFSEFRWAHFLRSRIPEALVAADFDCALARVLELSRGEAGTAPLGAHRPKPLAADHARTGGGMREPLWLRARSAHPAFEEAPSERPAIDPAFGCAPRPT